MKLTMTTMTTMTNLTVVVFIGSDFRVEKRY